MPGIPSGLGGLDPVILNAGGSVPVPGYTPLDQAVLIFPTPDVGSSFTGFSANPTTMNSDMTVDATFTANVVDVLVTEGAVVIGEGGNRAIEVVLSAQPAAGLVTVSVTPAGVISGNTAIFDETNWAVPQSITLSAAEDDADTADDINVPITVASDYFNGSPDTVNVTVTDDDFDLTMAVSGVGTTAPAVGTSTMDRDDLPQAIVATQGTGYTFVNWTNADGGATIDAPGSASTQISATTLPAVTAQANFTINTVDILVTQANVTIGEGGNQTIDVTLSAEPTGLMTISVTPNGDVRRQYSSV